MDTPDEYKLRQLIGCSVTLEGKQCQVIEVLSEGPSLVVECLESGTHIQGNQFGDGNRRVPKSHTIPVYSDANREEMSSLFKQIWRAIGSKS